MVALFAAMSAFGVGRMVRWDLVTIVNSRTLVVKSDEGEVRTITLAGIGTADDETVATNFIQKTIGGREIQFWPIDTAHTNWHERPMCVFYDFEREKGGSVVYDFPMLNEEMLKQGIASFTNSTVTGDEYKLMKRLEEAAEQKN